MKTNKSIYTFAFLLLTGLQAFASHSAIYLSAKENESSLVDRLDKKDGGQYKIYIRVDGKYTDRLVDRSELALPSEKAIAGHQKGQWALAKNPKNGMAETCVVDELYENGAMTVYCNTLINGGTLRSKVIHSNYLGTTENFVAEIKNSGSDIQVGDEAVLKVAAETIEAGSVVKVEHFFVNGNALVHGKGNRFGSLVNITDLQK